MIKKTPEVSVQQAADHLGVTTRSILNYIREKEIEAIKVGKTWFIKSPSLDAFITRYGFNKLEPEKVQDKVQDVGPETSATPASAPISGFTTQPKKKPTQSLSTLRLFEILKLSLLETKLLHQPENQVDNQSHLQDHFTNLKLEAIEFLGAGFYAYEFQHKKNYYNLSRQRISGLLSLLHSFDPSNVRIKILEDDLLPAYSSLIKRLEKTNEKKYEASKNLR